MVTTNRPSYVPALRMKAGELAGLRDLAPDVAVRVLPRMIIPPVEECDNALQAQLFSSQAAPNFADALAAHWRDRAVLVEATYLLREHGRDTVGRWLPKMFERARRASVDAIPLVRLEDLTNDSRDAYKESCGNGPVRLAIVISGGDLVSHEGLSPLLHQLEAIKILPSECSIIADFSDSDFNEPEIVAPIIGGALELLQEVGLWHQVVFQGTNYPDRNPAGPGSSYRVPRNEWHAWRKGVGFESATAEHMIYGDYAADCGVIAFGEAGGRAIRHYRYTTPEAWIVERGVDGGKDAVAMRDVCRRIVESTYFAGRAFSSADEFIFLTAQGEAGPGNATTWRSINTTHHITRVLADIGDVRGFALRPRAVPETMSQGILF